MPLSKLRARSHQAPRVSPSRRSPVRRSLRNRRSLRHCKDDHHGREDASHAEQVRLTLTIDHTGELKSIHFARVLSRRVVIRHKPFARIRHVRPKLLQKLRTRQRDRHFGVGDSGRSDLSRSEIRSGLVLVLPRERARPLLAAHFDSAAGLVCSSRFTAASADSTISAIVSRGDVTSNCRMARCRLACVAIAGAPKESPFKTPKSIASRRAAICPAPCWPASLIPEMTTGLPVTDTTKICIRAHLAPVRGIICHPRPSLSRLAPVHPPLVSIPQHLHCLL